MRHPPDLEKTVYDPLLSWHAQRSTALLREADVSRLVAAQRDTRRAAQLTSRAAALVERAERRTARPSGAQLTAPAVTS
jgi:hypothetical protein